MSFQIYFLQSEEDVDAFLGYVTNLGAVIWCNNNFIAPDDMKDTIKKHMASFMHQYIITPGEDPHLLDAIKSDRSSGSAGVEFLACSKNNALSRTYDVGRLFYRSDDSNPYNTQMLALYKKLKAYIRKNYYYSKNAGIYCAPEFRKKYDTKYFYATELGRPITL